MAYDPQILGDRLRAARENLGLSQEAAADHIGVPRTAISHIETGKRSISTLELSDLAALYRRPVAEFFTAVSEDEDPLVVLYRMIPGLEEPEFRSQVGQYIELCREGRHLENLLGRAKGPTVPEYEPPAPRNTPDAVRQGEAVADEERRRLGLGDTPIADMADLIASQGIWASGVEMPDEVSGLFLNHPSFGMAILVHLGHVRGRKRFSYAHEYAHALLDRRRMVTVTARGNRDELVEQRANAFAASFLMPPGGVEGLLLSLDKGQPSRAELSIFDVATEGAFEARSRARSGSQAISYRDVAMVAAHFNVSYPAAVYRLKSLGWINRAACDGLLRPDVSLLAKSYCEMLQLGGDSGLVQPDRELQRQVMHLALEAFSREEISAGRLFDLGRKLGISTSELRRHQEAARQP